MTEITHSQGPWSADGPAHSIIVYAADGTRVCFMTSDGPAIANARLIKAAPDLLTAVIDCLKELDRSQRPSYAWQLRAKEALAKVRG